MCQKQQNNFISHVLLFCDYIDALALVIDSTVLCRCVKLDYFN